MTCGKTSFPQALGSFHSYSRGDSYSDNETLLSIGKTHALFSFANNVLGNYESVARHDVPGSSEPWVMSWDYVDARPPVFLLPFLKSTDGEYTEISVPRRPCLSSIAHSTAGTGNTLRCKYVKVFVLCFAISYHLSVFCAFYQAFPDDGTTLAGLEFTNRAQGDFEYLVPRPFFISALCIKDYERFNCCPLTRVDVLFPLCYLHFLQSNMASTQPVRNARLQEGDIRPCQNFGPRHIFNKVSNFPRMSGPSINSHVGTNETGLPKFSPFLFRYSSNKPKTMRWLFIYRPINSTAIRIDSRTILNYFKSAIEVHQHGETDTIAGIMFNFRQGLPLYQTCECQQFDIDTTSAPNPIFPGPEISSQREVAFTDAHALLIHLEKPQNRHGHAVVNERLLHNIRIGCPHHSAELS
ncbi:uncharacterized protein FOMMEDRAFT_150683 [Fomitiporia mediterranea MF3/22]|uniref:uncharacterized protein n=1 Tax=Fomitiporia mediterranea (strain MF3/22) TaxID=694068 RepID=UPI0004409C42|nr:uncharacterized protein FOMMEDRAFT_150683 [Fomitiporia mediterranea MF3/22]EJD08027.1 hypothetical protein FOMMEDRAFT_150683 [Fomitiporia mediterranea MF3/22]